LAASLRAAVMWPGNHWMVMGESLQAKVKETSGAADYSRAAVPPEIMTLIIGKNKVTATGKTK